MNESTIERIEPRLLLAGVVISEFLASNVNGIVDEDSDHSDFIELRNTDPAPVNLAGWYLTDDALHLTKWQIPSTNVGAGQYLRVFASGKNRAVSGQPLHTNFALAQEGEYLALVVPDGTTVADSYAPYPDQRADVSYGVGVNTAGSQNVILIPPSASARVLSPSSQNAAVDDFWRNIIFNDAAWLATPMGIGFDRGDAELDGQFGMELTTGQMPTTRLSAYIRVPFNVVDKDQLMSLSLQMRYDDGFIAFLNGREVKRRFFQDDDARPQPQWDSRASSSRPDTEVLNPVTFDLTPYLPSLVNGTNMLAIHGVNQNSTNTDFLIDAQLTATRATGSVVGYMSAPTPAANNGLASLGFVGDTTFSHDRGFYSAAFDLEITSSTAGAVIRYTTDGTAPSETHGTLYTSPIHISATTTLRAVAFKAGFTPTNIDTQTYIFLADVIQQSNGDITLPFALWGHDKDDPDSLHNEPDWEMDPDVVNANLATIIDDLKAIPTMSLVMNWDDVFSGSPQLGTVGSSSLVPQGIYIDGKSDERPTSLEYFTADGSDEFQSDAAVEMQGHSSTIRWNADKMSFQVKFKFPYGETALNHALFGAGVATEYDTLILDAMFNYAWHHANHRQNAVARFVTDQVVSDLQNLAGGRAPHGKYVHLYLNGLYWGLYNIHERPDDAFAESYFGGDKDEYDVIKHNPTPDFTWAEGGVTALNNYNALLNATRQNMSVLANYNAVANLLDVDDFIDYMIVHYYAGNNDWAHNNWYASRNRVQSGAKWHFHAWDQEHAFPTSDNLPLGDTIGTDYDPTDKDDPSAPTEIHINLMGSAEYRLKFADRVHRLFDNGGVLTPDAAKAVYEARVAEIDRAIVGESARWGDNRIPINVTGTFPYTRTTPYTRADWVTTTNNLLADFFPGRSDFIVGRFGFRGWLVSLGAPLFSQFGGTFSPGLQLTLSKPPGSPGAAAIYYTLDGSDPRLNGGALSPSAIAYTGPITLNVATRVRARIRDGTNWSPITDANFFTPTLFPVRISEIHYHPADHPGVADPEDIEFMELLNTGDQTVSLQGVTITGAIDPYVFGAGVSLGAGERIVIARTRAVFEQVYGTGINLAPGDYDGRLDNAGEQIILLGPLGETLQSFIYDDNAPWPIAADGDGPSLEIIDPLGDPNLATNWRASSTSGGSPGTEGVVDNTPPTVTASDFLFETSQAISIQFSEDMNAASIAAGDVVIQPLPGGASFSPDSVVYNPATRTATFSFSTLLLDGNYRATLLAASVADLATNALAADHTLDFFTLAGDTNRDRIVDITDLGILASNWQQSPRSYSQGDFNYDTIVDITDLGMLATSWQKGLPPLQLRPIAKPSRQRMAEDVLGSADTASAESRRNSSV